VIIAVRPCSACFVFSLTCAVVSFLNSCCLDIFLFLYIFYMLPFFKLVSFNLNILSHCCHLLLIFEWNAVGLLKLSMNSSACYKKKYITEKHSEVWRIIWTQFMLVHVCDMSNELYFSVLPWKRLRNTAVCHQRHPPSTRENTVSVSFWIKRENISHYPR
jgi:hypothetical protein